MIDIFRAVDLMQLFMFLVSLCWSLQISLEEKIGTVLQAHGYHKSTIIDTFPVRLPATTTTTMLTDDSLSDNRQTCNYDGSPFSKLAAFLIPIDTEDVSKLRITPSNHQPTNGRV